MTFDLNADWRNQHGKNELNLQCRYIVKKFPKEEKIKELGESKNIIDIINLPGYKRGRNLGSKNVSGCDHDANRRES